MDIDSSDSRRAFLRFLAGSPALLHAEQAPDLITDPSASINVFDFEPAARKIFHPRIGATWQPESMTMPPCERIETGSIGCICDPAG